LHHPLKHFASFPQEAAVGIEICPSITSLISRLIRKFYFGLGKLMQGFHITENSITSSLKISISLLYSSCALFLYGSFESILIRRRLGDPVKEIECFGTTVCIQVG
jgi:hypothetical protein